MNFDPNGNTASDTAFNYLSDGENRLAVINMPGGSPTGSADTVAFQYDGRGRRVGITALNAGGPVTSVGQLSSAATVASYTYVWAGNRISEMRDSTGTQVLKRFYSQGEQQVNGTQSTPYYYTKDHLGSVREVTDSTGTVQAQFDYDPYGRQRQIQGTFQPTFGYTGQFQETTTGLNLHMAVAKRMVCNTSCRN